MGYFGGKVGEGGMRDGGWLYTGDEGGIVKGGQSLVKVMSNVNSLRSAVGGGGSLEKCLLSVSCEELEDTLRWDLSQCISTSNPRRGPPPK